ncbi:MAG: cellulase family glycosylhydrolase [Aquabacterium sp.]|uniref:cellulase family glycosylhydrolase n=1 Tax=Aquabacterium sp. TaxID=1872578 RepID=UPI00271CD3E2|nr:cellulase family glycosylhydrolase [Aquabacterium sp.]MDO9002640.1 cellulase family glycosylhydrolase [Aquabacterium sp.]
MKCFWIPLLMSGVVCMAAEPVKGVPLVAESGPAWEASLGREFPGAAASMSQAKVGARSKVARLHYDLGCGAAKPKAASGKACGRYVAMSLRLKAPMAVGPSERPAIAFDIRNLDGHAQTSLRVVDATGQNHQFKARARSLENPSGQAWQRVQVGVGKSRAFWGGAADGVLHPPIKALSVLVGDMGLLQPPGIVEVDNLTYLPSNDVAYQLKLDGPLSGQTFAPSYVGRLAVALHRPLEFHQLDKARSAGITVIRTDVYWDKVESGGKFNFDRYEKLASELSKRGMSALWILDYGHPEHGGKAPLTERDRAAFAEFARQAARHLKGKSTLGFEIWNEPNLAHYWPKPDPVAYATLLSEAMKAIREVQPAAVVVSAGLANTDEGYLLRMAESGKLAGVSAVSLHPYRKEGPESFATFVAPLQQVLQAHGVQAPLWDTEWGYSSFGDIDAKEFGHGHDPRALRQQGILVLRKVLTQLALDIPLHTIYDMTDDGDDPRNREHNFGLLTRDGADKPAMTGLRSLLTAQTGRVFKGPAPDVPPGLHVLRWDSPTDQTYAVWVDTPDRTAVVSLPKAVKVKKGLWWDGKPWQGKADSVRLTEQDGPLFVTVGR